MITDFTKIHCFGENCILITIREKAREPILILTGQDIEKLNQEWNSQKKRENTTKDINSLPMSSSVHNLGLSSDIHSQINKELDKDYAKTTNKVGDRK